MRNDSTLKRWFKQFNERYFENSLPDAICFWEPALVPQDALGDIQEQAGTFIIRIDPAIRFTNCFAKLVLVHEMAHLRVWPYTGHGKKWQNEMLRLAQLGAFKRLW